MSFGFVFPNISSDKQGLNHVGTMYLSPGGNIWTRFDSDLFLYVTRIYPHVVPNQYVNPATQVQYPVVNITNYGNYIVVNAYGTNVSMLITLFAT